MYLAKKLTITSKYKMHLNIQQKLHQKTTKEIKSGLVCKLHLSNNICCTKKETKKIKSDSTYL
jgi:hypothetical protein